MTDKRIDSPLADDDGDAIKRITPARFAELDKSTVTLLDLRDTIRQRKDEDLTPVSETNVPNELLPLVDAINYHMSRLERLLQSRRRFLADAAHQIRTPLTVLGTQAEYGLRQNDPEEMRRTFGSMIDTIRGTRRMANQMLTLARAEPANGLIQEFSRLDFGELACDVTGELASLALQNSVSGRSGKRERIAW